MRVIPIARTTYQQGTTLTDARTWRVVRRDGQIFTFTSAVADLVINGETYSAATGFLPSAAVTSATLGVDNLEVSGFLNSASITEVDIVAGRWDNATIYVTDVNYLNPAQGATIIAVGFVGKISATRVGFTMEMRGLSQLLAQKIGRTVTAACDANVFDARCGKDPTPYIKLGSVTGGNTDNKHFADTSITHASGWFDFGMLTWLTGANAGLSQEIKRQDYQSFTLQLRMPFPIAVGDTYTMLPGCNKILKGGPSGASVSGAVYGTTAWDNFTALGFAQPSGFLNNALLTWTSGANTSTVVHISTHVFDGTYGNFVLTSAMSSAIAAGDKFTLVPDATIIQNFSTGTYNGDCKIKYNNAPNHRGYAEVPGINKTVGSANAATHVA